MLVFVKEYYIILVSLANLINSFTLADLCAYNTFVIRGSLDDTTLPLGSR